MKKSTASENTNKKLKFFGHQLPNGSTNGLALDTPIVIRSGNYNDTEVKVI